MGIKDIMRKRAKLKKEAGRKGTFLMRTSKLEQLAKLKKAGADISKISRLESKKTLENRLSERKRGSKTFRALTQKGLNRKEWLYEVGDLKGKFLMKTSRLGVLYDLKTEGVNINKISRKVSEKSLENMLNEVIEAKRRGIKERDIRKIIGKYTK